MLFPQRLKTQECRDTNLWHLVERTVLPLPTVRNFFSPKLSWNQIGLYSYRWVATDWQLFYLASAFLLSFKFSTFAKKVSKKGHRNSFWEKKRRKFNLGIVKASEKLAFLMLMEEFCLERLRFLFLCFQFFAIMLLRLFEPYPDSGY